MAVRKTEKPTTSSTNSSTKSANSTSGPRSLTRILGLFDMLADDPEGKSLTELSSELKSPKSSLLNLFRPLVTEGFLVHEHGVYKIGPSLFRLSAKVLSSWNFTGVMHQYLQELSSKCGESVFLGVLDRELGLITYVDSIDSSQSIRYSVAVGASRPLYCTAAGRILLAYEDPQWVANYMKESTFEKLTPDTIANKRALAKVLDEVRKEGVAACIGELYYDSGGVAAPIFGTDGRIIAALGIGAPGQRLQPKLDTLKKYVSDVAKKASGMR